MDSIRCPHCGSVSQDVSLKDSCWKCGKILGAKSDTPLETKSVIAPASLEERVVMRKASKKTTLSPALVIVLLVLLLILLFLLINRHL